MNKRIILTAPMKTMVPIIKVVGNFCNLRCKYCFYNATDQSVRKVMRDDLIKQFISEYLQLFSGQLFFIWHGGEPLLAGIDFFRKVVDIQRKNTKNGQIIKNAIQTNATLVNEDWSRFFKLYDFKIGVSLDGNKESHDHFRINCENRGSFEDSVRGVEILKKHGINPGIIQTMTNNNVCRVKENSKFFFDELDIKSLGVNIYLDSDKLNKSMIGQEIRNDELVKLLKECINIWLNRNDSTLRIREIENFISGVFNKKAPGCSFNGSCTGYFCLDYDGKIYPCDRFSGHPELLFGDISKISLPETLNSPIRLSYARAVNKVHPDCYSCEWLNSCHNGCSHHRTGGLSGKYYYCKARKIIFAYLKSVVEKHLK